MTDLLKLVSSALRNDLDVWAYVKDVLGRLAPWCDDERFEYLLAAHPEQCRSVESRLRWASDRHLPGGNPQLWSVVLEQMAADESIADVGSALEHVLRSRLPADFLDRRFDERRIGTFPQPQRGDDASELLAALLVEPGLIGLLRHRVMRMVLAAAHLPRAIERGQYRWWLAGRLPRDTVDRVAATMSPDGVANLWQMTGENQPEVHATAASILHGAAMADIDWEQADLRNANLRGCVFHMGSSRSGLVGSPLASEGSRTGFYTDEYDQQSFRPPEEIRKANLRGADLRGASLRETDFYLVDLRDAKYSRSQSEHFRRSGAILFDPHNG